MVLTDPAVQGLGEGRALNRHHKGCRGREGPNLLDAIQVGSKAIGPGGQAGLHSNPGSTFSYHVNLGRVPKLHLNSTGMVALIVKTCG